MFPFFLSVFGFFPSLLYARYACTGYRKDTWQDIGVRVLIVKISRIANASQMSSCKRCEGCRKTELVRVNPYRLNTISSREPYIRGMCVNPQSQWATVTTPPILLLMNSGARC